MVTHGEEAGSRWLKWGLAALVGLPLMCGGCGLAGFLYVRSESPYEDAVARTTGHRKVLRALGEPVSADFLFKGQMRSKGNDGIATMEIGLSGSKQDGTLYVKGVQTSGVWGFSMLKVVAHDGTVINVVGD
uniref:Cytochrome oxidase complex assembly protein 1 n=1 Tax=Vitiosangium cumulatum TaxID=1867796 RepID=A0A7D4XT91_9BACT|nr:cytochrome oxidase complex assembly protein 1 [Vitiosangium cumulatum]